MGKGGFQRKVHSEQKQGYVELLARQSSMWMLPVASGLLVSGAVKMPLEPTVVSGPPDFT